MDLSTNFNIVFGELLPLLFTHSTTSALIRNRLVCREWNKVATKILLERGDLKIQFKLIFNQTHKDVPTFYSYKVKDLLESKLCMTHNRSALENLPEGRTLPHFFRLVSSSSSPSFCSWSSPHQIVSSLPVQHFEFHFGHVDVNQPQFLSFAQNYGPNIETLTLNDFFQKFWCHNTLADFILHYMPNLKSLRLHVMTRHYRDRNGSREGAINTLGLNKGASQLNLKFIEIIRKFDSYADSDKERRWRFFYSRPNLPSKIVAPLLKNAPRLARVSFQNPRIENLVEVFLPAKANLMHVTTLHLREYELFLQGQESLEKLVEVLATNPQGLGLKCLRLSVAEWPPSQDSWKRGTACIRQILEANSNTLNTLVLVFGAASILHKTPFLPVLPKVTKLVGALESPNGDSPGDFVAVENPFYVLGFIDDGDGSPRGLPLSALLPNLETLDLQGCGVLDYGISDKWFPYWEDELRQVTTLKTSALPRTHASTGEPGERPKTYDRSLNLCPEVASFFISSQFYRLPSVLTPIWRATQLTMMNIQFYELSDGVIDNHLDFDAAITGLSKQEVPAIYEYWQLTGRWERSTVGGTGNDVDYKNRTCRSSLSNLQNLQKLQLEFSIDEEVTPKMFVSGVSAKFGFDLIKNLKVSIVFNCSFRIEHQRESTEWLTVHESLSSFPNVTVGLKEYTECCSTHAVDESPWRSAEGNL